MNARKPLMLVLIFLVLLALPFAGRYASYYTRAPSRPEIDRPTLDQIEVPTPPYSPFNDEVSRAGDGIVLVDMAHDNQLQMGELNVLAGRLAARGHQLESWTGGNLADELLQASAFVVAVPLSPYDEDEVEVVRRFVETGGRLLLIGDPTRYNYLVDDLGWSTGVDSDARYLNSLGTPFGIAFVDDYLYNVNDHEGNFRNIKLNRWGESEVVVGLETVVFFAAHSLAVPDEAAVILADEETWSSASDRAGGLVVSAQMADGRVLALGDMTFMTEPYHTVRDNSRLVAQVADFLTAGERSYALEDFPLLFGDEVSLQFANNPELGSGQLLLVDDLQEAFADTGRALILSDAAPEGKDTLYVGLYSQYEPVREQLDLYGITLTLTSTMGTDVGLSEDDEVDSAPMEGEEEGEEGASEDAEPLERVVFITGLGRFAMSGVGLILLHSGDGYQVMTVLAASQDGLSNLLGRLVEGSLTDCVQADAVTLCPTNVPSEQVEMEWEPIEAEERPDLEDGEDEEGDLSAEVEGELSYGDTVSSDFEEGDEHLWLFSGTAGDLITILVDTTNIELDLVLELEGPDGDLIASADESTSGEEKISDYELPQSGDYLIHVREYSEQSGSYTLELYQEIGGGGDEGTGGTIAFGETVQGSLAEGERAAWTFTGEADQAITIIVEPDDDADMILELQGADAETIVVVDDTFGGEEERIEGILPSDGDYRILVEEYYGDPVTYTLTLEEGGEGGVLGGRGVLVVSADDGEPLLDGRTSADIYMDVLSPNYEVALWTLSTDGPIDLESVEGYQLVIWTSGDFQVGEDQMAPLLFLGEGRPLLLTGASLPFLGNEETAVLRDVEVSEGASSLTAGFTALEIIELSDEIEAMVLQYEEGFDEGSIPILNRGPASEEAGDVIAAALDDEFSGMRFLLVGFPVYLLPESAQTQLINNAVEWFGVDPLP